MTHKYPVRSFGFIQNFVLDTDSTINLYKVRNLRSEQKQLESCTIDSDSLVCQVSQTLSFMLSSRSGHVKPWLKPGGPPSKAKYILWSIANKYREGKVKRTPEGEWNRSWNYVRTKSRSRLVRWRRAFCRTIQRVIYCCKLKIFIVGAVKASLNRAK